MVAHISDATPPHSESTAGAPAGTDELKTAIAWGNADLVVEFFRGRSESDRSLFAPLLLGERERFWPLIAEEFGAEPDHHRIRSAWRAGLAAIFASASKGEIIEQTQVEHAYDEAYSTAVVGVLDERRPAWLIEWIDSACARHPSGRLLTAIASLVESGAVTEVQIDTNIGDLIAASANDPTPEVEWIAALITLAEGGYTTPERLDDAIEHTLRTSTSNSGQLWLRDLRSSLRRALGLSNPPAPADSAVIAIPTPLRAIRSGQDLRPLTPADRRLEQRLADSHAPQSWHWQLASALFETRLRHDHETAATHFERARAASDDHSEVMGESAFFKDHVIKDKLSAEREYEQAMERAVEAPYELYNPDLTSLLGRTYFDSSALLAKYAGFLARERDDMSTAETYLERALFARRRLGANAAAVDPDHIAFLRQLATVASGDADPDSLFGFDEWSGPSQIILELNQ